jgi:hypothetical protein
MSQPFIRDPSDVDDYLINWAPWLGTDTISASSWTVPTGLTKDSDTKTTTTATIWLSGGTAKTEYRVANKITTAGGRTKERSFTVLVENL